MQKKIVMVTAYDYPSAKVLEEVGVDYILVGDSLAMSILGYPDTKSITMTEMLHHLKAVVRGAPKSKIIADMPINTYKTPTLALKNAQKFIKEGAYGVKIEGADFSVIKTLIAHQIKVVGHLGLLPQTAEKYKVFGRETYEAKKILADAQMLDKLGVIALILECLPAELAQKISKEIKSPTIGIGAGIHCDGQVLVLADLIGLSEFKGKMIKRYLEMKSLLAEAVAAFKRDVLEEKFPKEENSFS